MVKKKATKTLKRIVLEEKRKFPYFGVRELAKQIAKKHKIDVSKSLVHNILRDKGLGSKPGRKKDLERYQLKELGNCGLILLHCLDYYFGFFDYITQSLKVYFPRLKTDLLRKIIILESLFYLVDKDINLSSKIGDLSRISGIKVLPIKKLKFFAKRISEYTPTIIFKPIKEKAVFITTLKFYFKNGNLGFLDAKLSTFWDSPNNISKFYLPFGAVSLRLDNMLKDKLIILGYTKSFDYLSPVVFDFLSGIESGLKKIELLGIKGKVVDTINITDPKINVLVGYCPKILSKGMAFMAKPKKFKRFFWSELGEIFATNVSTKFIHPKAKKEAVLSNILIKGNLRSFPSWGIFSNLSISIKNIESLLKKYLYSWPYIEKDFFAEMEIIDKALFSESKTVDFLQKMIPEKISFKDQRNFVRIGQILSVIFKEIIWGWEPKRKRGNFRLGKDYMLISLMNTPKEVKKSFNKACLCIGKRRVFIS